LQVKRQQGASRKRSVRCEVCRAKYKTAQLPAGAPQSQGLLLPRIWSDPYAIAAVLHGAWRAYVVTSGLWRAWSLYRSINASAALQQQALCAHAPGSSSSSGGRFRGGGGGTTRSGVRIGVAAPLPPTAREPQPLRHHLSLSVPLRGGVTRQQQLQQGGGGGVPGGSSSKAVLDTIRERFDKATMVQVGVLLNHSCWHCHSPPWTLTLLLPSLVSRPHSTCTNTHLHLHTHHRSTGTRRSWASPRCRPT
jgi:hypothetical protein